MHITVLWWGQGCTLLEYIIQHSTQSKKYLVFRRMEEVKRSEQRATVEDLMYASVLEKFVDVGVDMLPRLENIIESPANLKVRDRAFFASPALHYRMCQPLQQNRGWILMLRSIAGPDRGHPHQGGAGSCEGACARHHGPSSCRVFQRHDQDVQAPGCPGELQDR